MGFRLGFYFVEALFLGALCWLGCSFAAIAWKARGTSRFGSQLGVRGFVFIFVLLFAINAVFSEWIGHEFILLFPLAVSIACGGFVVWIIFHVRRKLTENG